MKRSVSRVGLALVAAAAVALSGSPLNAQQAPVAAPAGEPRALIEELLELSGAKRAQVQGLRQIEAGAQRIVPALAPKLGPDDQQRLGDAITRAFQPDAVRDALLAEFNADHVAALLAGYRSPLGRRFTDSEVAIPAPEEVARFTAELQTSPPRRERLALLQRLDAATGRGDLFANMMPALLKAIVPPIEALLPPAERIPRDLLEKEVEKLRPMLQAQALLGWLFAYRSFPEPDLQQYVQFLESDAAKWRTRVGIKVFRDAIGLAGRNVAGEVTAMVQERERKAREEFRVQLRREAGALMSRGTAIAAKIEARIPYDEITGEANALKRELEAFKNRHLVALRKESDDFVNAALGASDALSDMFEAWRAERREEAYVASLQEALEAAKRRLARDPSAGTRGEVWQHEYNLQVAQRRHAEARGRRLAQWEGAKRSLDEASRIVPASRELSPLRIWKVGSPHDGQVPPADLPPALAERIQELGRSPEVTAFAAAEFPRQFLQALSRGEAPDIVAGNNYLPFGELFRQPNLQQRMPSVSKALEAVGNFVFLYRESPSFEQVKKIALRAPGCDPRWRPSSTSLSGDLNQIMITLAEAYLKGDAAGLRRYEDDNRLRAEGARPSASRVESLRDCVYWGNENLAFVAAVGAFESQDLLGHTTVLLVFRRQENRWRLLLAARDPLSIQALQNAVPTLANLLSKTPTAEANPLPAQLLVPPDRQNPTPRAGERFGDFIWKPSPSPNTIAELVEFAYQGDARLFIRLRSQQDVAEDRISAGMLWTTNSLWKWRVWSITADGAVAFSDARSFVH